MAQCGSEPSADDAEGSHAHLEQLEQLHLKRRAVSRSLCLHFLLLPRALFCPPSLAAVAFCKSHPSVGALEWQPAEESWLNGKEEEREDTRGHLTRRRIICHEVGGVDHLIMTSSEAGRERDTEKRGVEGKV